MQQRRVLQHQTQESLALFQKNRAAVEKSDGKQAKKYVQSMRQNLVQASSAAMSQQKLAEEDGDTEEITKVSPVLKDIAGKIGVVKDLEKRLDIMQGLDPLMDGILQKMNMVTDNSNLRKIQIENDFNDATQRANEAAADKAAVDGLVIHHPLQFETPKDVAVRNVVRTTLKKIEHENIGNPAGEAEGKITAINSIARAVDAENIRNDIRSTRPDEHTHTTTVVDHSTENAILGTPATVTKSISTVRNSVPYVESSGVIRGETVLNPTAVIVADDHPGKKAIQDNVKAINDESNKQTVKNILGSLVDYQNMKLQKN